MSLARLDKAAWAFNKRILRICDKYRNILMCWSIVGYGILEMIQFQFRQNFELSEFELLVFHLSFIHLFNYLFIFIYLLSQPMIHCYTFCCLWYRREQFLPMLSFSQCSLVFEDMLSAHSWKYWYSTSEFSLSIAQLCRMEIYKLW